jgi:hypothetical protein
VSEKGSLLNLFKSIPPRISRDTYKKLKSKGYTDKTVFDLDELDKQGLLI